MNKRYSFIIRYNGQHWHTGPSLNNMVLTHCKVALRRLISEGLLPIDIAEEQYKLCKTYLNIIRERRSTEINGQKHTIEIKNLLTGIVEPKQKLAIPKDADIKDVQRYRTYASKALRNGHTLFTFEEYFAKKRRVGRCRHRSDLPEGVSFNDFYAHQKHIKKCTEKGIESLSLEAYALTIKRRIIKVVE